MEKIITYETLRNFTYSNDDLIKGEIKGFILNFMGLGFSSMYSNDSDGDFYAEKGLVYLIPYFNPWSWMNKQTVDFVDEIIEVICEKYSLDRENTKIVSTGGSMGGLSALVYCSYAKITPCACATVCPVCDLVYHFTERPDLPRTLYSAFGGYDGTFEDALKSASPLHLVDKLPDIPYSIFHSDKDMAVNIDLHSRKFVEAMKKTHNIDFVVSPDRDHCDLTEESWKGYRSAILKPFESDI